MINENFAVFILTYGRPDKVITVKTLNEAGYTGRTYLVCSTDDKTLDVYKKNFGDSVKVFSKEDYKGKFDIGDNFNDDRVVVYARNAVWDIAKELNLDYFLVLDDDYTCFNYRYDDKLDYTTRGTIKNGLDDLFNLIIHYLKSIPAKCIALAQGGDFIGGSEGSMAQGIATKRKIMNTFFCKTKEPFKFIGRINEDVNTYVTMGNRGELVFQTNQLGIEQITTQKNEGGLTEFYLDGGTYVKSFYTVMFAPSCAKINLMGNKFKRLHHVISWKNTTPYIIQERFKK
jgi:hypothetical protein